MSGVEVVVDGRALVGESPWWDPVGATLVWVDILRRELHRYSPATGEDTVLRVDRPLGAVLPRAGGGLVAAAGTGVALLDEESGKLTELARADRGDRMNDAGCDPAGRLWAGTLTADQRPGGAGLYRLDPGGLVRVLDATLSNGLAWSPDGATLYYADTPTEVVAAFDYDLATGALGERRTLVDLHGAPGRPDGLTVDAEGGVWVAMARGGQLRRYSPAGALEHLVEVGTPTVTNCAFGGEDLADLYATTLCVGLGEAELLRRPLAGALLRVPAGGARGLPPAAFAG